MDKTSPCYRRVALLVWTLLYVVDEPCLVLKGGAAINLFIRDFPRLSADTDLAYIPLRNREVTLPNVWEALACIAVELETQAGLSAVLQTDNPDGVHITVITSDAQIKIKAPSVARGTLYPSQERDVVEVVEEGLGFAVIPIVSLPDLYGGKLCAALDRQRPRDFYDIKVLLDTQGTDYAIFDGFIAYLLSHNRPLSGVLSPRWKDITEPFQNESSGMTFEEVSLEELREVPERMLSALEVHFTQQDFDFLRPLKRGEPDWNLAPEPHIQNLPAVQWKLRNIGRMSEEKCA